ncbi:MAG: hypothetical protein FWG17_07215 [Desulfovibrionaceae bacterium]|nr:hypothetical protein [Desulfovibrionaceae bacterium]
MDANNLIDAILKDIGIETTDQFKNHSLAASGSEKNGFHSYNDYDWNLISTRVDAGSGGSIQFGYSFVSGDTKHGDDASFWFLRDPVTNEIVTSGMLGQGNPPTSGICLIDLEALQNHPGYSGGELVLVIGLMNVGEYYSPQSVGNPHLLLTDVVQYADSPSAPDFKGDFIPDDSATLASVTIDGVKYEFDQDTRQHEIEIPGQGTLIVADDGSFRFYTEDGKETSDVFWRGEYELDDGSTRSFGLDGTLTADLMGVVDHGAALPGADPLGIMGAHAFLDHEGLPDILTEPHPDEHLIFATSADELMHGGDHDIFVWQHSAMGGQDEIMDFNLGEDKLFFEDMFSLSSGEDMEEQISNMLSDGELLLSISDNSHLELSYNHGGDHQTVLIDLVNPLDNATFNSLQNDDAATKAQLLQQILQASLG